MGDEEVCTIFVAGLPADAQHRELENMMRFMPGYEGIKPAGAKGGSKGGAATFVKFDCADNAFLAMKVLHEQPFDLRYSDQLMRVEMAKSNMKKPATAPQAYRAPMAAPVYHPPPVVRYQPPVATYDAAPLAKRARTSEAPGSVDTIAIFGALEKGYTEAQLEDFFVQLPGYMCFKSNARTGGGFAKFQTPYQAQDALEAALSNGLQAQLAKTSMNSPASDAGSSAGGGYAAPAPITYAPPRPAYGSGKGAGKSAGPPRQGGAGGGGVDTLILQGLMEKGWTTADVTDILQTVPGFVQFKENHKVGGGFAKFADPQYANDAIAVLAEQSVDAKPARSSMN